MSKMEEKKVIEMYRRARIVDDGDGRFAVIYRGKEIDEQLTKIEYARDVIDHMFEK